MKSSNIQKMPKAGQAGNGTKPHVASSTGKRRIANTFIKPSKIHGLGLFAKCDIKKGQRIIQGLADFGYYDEWITYVKKWKLTSFAHNNGYCMVNHSEEPNTKRGSNSEIIAAKDILSGEEVTEDYYALPDNENPFINSFEEFLYRLKGR